MTKHMTLDQARTETFRILDVLDAGLPSFDTSSRCIADLRKAARRLQYLGERECNGVIGPDGYAKWDDADQASNDKARTKAETSATAALDALLDTETRGRVEIEFQGDPRGAPILIHEKGGRQRIAVYW
jgi:hypothetical protein